MRRCAFTLGLMLLVAGDARAHDPYEITATMYLHANRIELFLELEFPTAMILAGQTPVITLPAEGQLAAARADLERCAGGFFQVTAGNHRLQPVRTNVLLGVEDHVHFQLQYAPTDYRPLRFVPRGLLAGGDTPYGISLTVLDMMNNKVLGQATLFANSPPADIPPAESLVAPLAPPVVAVATAGTQGNGALASNVVMTDPADQPVRKPRGRGALLAVTLLLCGAGMLVLLRYLRRHPR